MRGGGLAKSSAPTAPVDWVLAPLGEYLECERYALPAADA
jgi:hypothetical protein